MKIITQVEFLEIEEKEDYIDFVNNVFEACFKEEGLDKLNLYVSITLTNPENIKKYNSEFRNIAKETDVLSFPMFEKADLEQILEQQNDMIDVLGDIVVSIEKVKEQAIEYGNSFEREFAYMLVHGFYHLMGYDHMEESEKQEMRQKEEVVLAKLNIVRE